MRTMWPICKYAHSMSGHLNPPSRRGAGQLHHPQWDTARPFWPGDWTSWPHRPVHLLMPLVHHSWSRLFPSLSFKRNENSLSHPLLLAACLVAWTELEKFYTHTSHTHTHCTLTHHTPTFPPMAPPPGIHVCLPTHLTPQPPFWVLVGSRLLLKPSLFYPRRGTTYPLMHLHQMCCLLKRDQNILPSLSSANTQPRDKTQGQSRAKTCWARLFLPSHIYTIVIFSQICGFFLFPSFFSLFPSSLFFSPQVPLRVHRLWHEQGWLNAHYHVSTWRALKCLQGHLEFSTMLGAPHSLYVRPASLI